MYSLLNINAKSELDPFLEVAVKLEPSVGSESVQMCRLCLAPKSAARLTLRDLAPFYCVFTPCGLGRDERVSALVSWVCQYCWVRACQCIKFIECARRAEHLHRIRLDNKEVTEETLHNAKTKTNNFKSVELVTTACSLLSVGGHFEESSDINQCVVIAFCQPPCETTPNFTDDIEFSSSTSEQNIELHTQQRKKHSGRSRKSKKSPQLKKSKHDSALKDLEMKIIFLTKEEQLEKVEKRKKSDRYLNATYKCEKCAIGFQEIDAMTAHDKIHDTSRGEYVCDICEKRYPDSTTLLHHRHRHARLYQCLRCGTSVADRAQAVIHHATCSDSEPAACQHCGKIMSDKLKLVRHVSRVHVLQAKFSCDICGRAFKAKQTIRTHMRTHTGETPFHCTQCDKRTTSFTLLRSHMQSHAAPTEENRADSFCVECNQQFKDKKFLRRHLKSSLKHNTRDSFKYACTECGARLSSKTALRNHLNAKHLEIRTHACTQCDKAFMYKSSLILHTKEKHSIVAPRVKRFICQVCGNAFLSVQILKSHSRIHKDERPFACLLCPATFKFSAAHYTHCKLKHKTTPARLKEMMGATSSA